MALNLGVHVSEQATSVSTPVVADVGVPYVVGAAPVFAAAKPAKTGVPVLCTSWDEAVEKLGFSYDWKSYPLCEFMYSHFKLYGCQPAIFCNVLDPDKSREAQAGKNYTVVDHQAALPFAATNMTVARGVEGDGEDHATVTLDGGEWKGVKSKDLMCPGTRILTDGAVIGNIPYSFANAEYGEGKEEGYYLPVNLGAEYASKKYKMIRKGGTDLDGTSSMFDSDPQMILSLGKDATKAKKCTVEFYEVEAAETEVPGELHPFLTLSFSQANFLPKDAPAVFAEDEDYCVIYDENADACLVELLSGGSYYEGERLYIEFTAVKPEKVAVTDIVSGLDAIDACLSKVGIIPDLICAPGWSHNTVVAALMATKSEAGINGLFRAKALIDCDSGEDGVHEYSELIEYKNRNNFVDENEILCWPMVKLGDYMFHMSTQLAGLMAQVDSGNGGVPFESPSNKNFQMDCCCLEDGTEVDLTFNQTVVLAGYGIVTALNFMSMGWVARNNYTACYPANTDVKDQFIPVSRMFDFVANTLIRTFWSKLDKPMRLRLLDNIQDTVNIWLNGLVSQEYLLGARVELKGTENPLTSLLAGIIKFHIYITPPVPAQEIEFVLEYDVNYLTSALNLAA